MNKLKYILTLLITLTVISTTAQNSDSLAQAHAKEVKFNLAKAQQLLGVKANNPDSFYKNNLGFDLSLKYLYAEDTVNFYKYGNEYLAMPDSNDMFHGKTHLCKLLYRVAEKSNDTLKMIDYAQKRLFKYNRLHCYIGEQSFRNHLCNTLIAIYTKQGETEKVKQLQKTLRIIPKHYKLPLPKYLSKA